MTLIQCILFCQTDHCCPNILFCLSDVCLCVSHCGVKLLLWCLMFTGIIIILLKFQPAVVLLSGFIFTYPVPSPTVTLRVKSTLLKEFTQTTKVCEQERYQITQTILLLINAWIHVGWVCMRDVVSITLWKMSSGMDGSPFSVTTDAFYCDNNLHVLLLL